MKSLEGLVRGEFIGLEATVRGPGLRNPVTGRVIDETRNMIRLERAGRKWTIPKKGSRIAVSLDGEAVEISGDLLVGSPEERIKKKIRGGVV